MSLRQAPGYQARLSSKSDMINTRRGRCDYRFVAADGSVSNLSLSWVIALSKCTHRGRRPAAAVNNSAVCVSTLQDKWSPAQIKVPSLNGIGNFCRNHARPMTYQTTNSLRRSRRKSYILFYRSSHLSKSKSITGAGATNGYRMFSTWYPISDRWPSECTFRI